MAARSSEDDDARLPGRRVRAHVAVGFAAGSALVLVDEAIALRFQRAAHEVEAVGVVECVDRVVCGVAEAFGGGLDGAGLREREGTLGIFLRFARGVPGDGLGDV